MERLGVTAAALLLGGSLVAGAVVTAAAVAVDPDRPPKVMAKDLPATAGVAALHPALEGGSRYVTRRAKGVLLRSSDDCVATTQVARADRGTRADFFLAGDLDPFEQGLEDPTVSGLRFLDEAAAGSLLAQVREHVAACTGEHAGEEDRTVVLTPLPAPDLGDEAVAMALTVSWPGGGYRLLDVLVRDGLSVSRVQVKHLDADPDLDRALALAGLAVDRLAPGRG